MTGGLTPGPRGDTLCAGRYGLTRILKLIILAASVLPGCAQRAPAPQPWLWFGANSRNSLLFEQAGSRPGRLEYRRVWDAERYQPQPLICGPVGDSRASQLAALDLDGDGSPEILPAGPHHDAHVILHSNGVPISHGNEPASYHRHGRPLLGRGAAARTLPLPRPLVASSRPGHPIWLVEVNGAPVFLELDAPRQPSSGSGNYAVTASDSAGRELWSVPLAPLPMLWAVADIDGDTSDDILVGTYGEEHGLRVNGTTDAESAYCIALGADGRLLWQTAFGGSHFLGCRAAVADLDADGRPEVVCAVHTWHNRYGGIYVLDGATGWVRASFTGPESLPSSHVSVGVADIDADGRSEIVATTAGPNSWLVVYRFLHETLAVAARRRLGTVADSNGVYYGLLHAIADLDGDRRYELVACGARCRPVCCDPVYYPTRTDSSCVTVFDAALEPRATLALPERCRSLLVGDLVRGGNLEILVRTDRLTLFSTDRKGR